MIRFRFDIERVPLLRGSVFALFFFLACCHAISEEKVEVRPMVLIANLENPVDEISKGELGRIYLKQKRYWLNGERCVPIDQPGTSEIRESFYQAVLNKDPYTMKRYWMQETMTGNAKPPVTLDNAATVKRYVRKIAGGVGYIYADEIDDSVKVLRVIDTPEFGVTEDETDEDTDVSNENSSKGDSAAP